MSYLNLDDDMYLVYDFKKDMKNRKKKEHIEDTRLLSLNDESIFGIKKDKGLFASEEWWSNIDSGQIITRSVSGVISSIYEAGMERRNIPNSFSFIDGEGIVRNESMYMMNKSDRHLFCEGKKIAIFYAYDELKRSKQKKGDVIDLENNYVKQVIEMAISK